MHVAKVIFPE